MQEESKGTLTKCVQAGKGGDSAQIENNPGLFAAEQTWPTEDELSKPVRKLSAASEEMVDKEQGVNMSNVIGSYKTGGKEIKGKEDLA